MREPVEPGAGHTRRSVLAAGLLAAGAAGVAGCGDDDEELAAERDAALLNVALENEHALVAAYTAGLELLRDGALREARRFLAQEREHVRILEREIARLGGIPRPPALMEEYRRGFPRLRDEGDAVRFLVDLENASVRAYHEALSRLASRPQRRLAGSIATVDAEHASVLLAESGRPPLPEAFVTGKS